MENFLIFYFHGYNSSPNSDKVEKIRSVFENTYAFSIDPDPTVSIPNLIKQIECVLLDDKFMNKDDLNIVFIGTSLGAWYASTLGHMFNVKSILINPCYDPTKTLKLLGGIPDDVCEKYTTLAFGDRSKVYISTNDEVIDYTSIQNTLETLDVTYVKNSNHRFNGPEFDDVLLDIMEYRS